jgi:hypothetical protein
MRRDTNDLLLSFAPNLSIADLENDGVQGPDIVGSGIALRYACSFFCELRRDGLHRHMMLLEDLGFVILALSLLPRFETHSTSWWSCLLGLEGILSTTYT